MTTNFQQWASATSLFETTGHAEIPLRRLAKARVLWKDMGALERDPHWAMFRSNGDSIDDFLLRRCAYEVAPDKASADLGGFADRYGGAGIGINGGSGRAAYFNGYHVKGIGRTPLVSPRIGFAHASGGAYLEEGVREAVFSKIVGALFPHSAVPTLALIDTGNVQIWQTENGPKPERKILVVRPQFVRPAHFQRAFSHIGEDPLVGVQDERRVARMFGSMADRLSREEIAQVFDTFGVNWARQMAHGFVWRLLHSSYTTSNVALDGRLLDFGAMSAVPSWANVWTMRRPQPLASLFPYIEDALTQLKYYLGRYVSSDVGSTAQHRQRLQNARAAWQDQLDRSMLEFLGVEKPRQWHAGLSEVELRELRMARQAVFDHYQSKCVDFYDQPIDGDLWDVATIWKKPANAPLSRLRDLLSGSATDPEQGFLEVSTRAVPLERLYRQSAKAHIYEKLEGRPELSEAELGAMIESFVDVATSNVAGSRGAGILRVECHDTPVQFDRRLLGVAEA